MPSACRCPLHATLFSQVFTSRMFLFLPAGRRHFLALSYGYQCGGLRDLMSLSDLPCDPHRLLHKEVHHGIPHDFP